MRWMALVLMMVGCSSGSTGTRALPAAGNTAPAMCQAENADACACQASATEGTDPCGQPCTCEAVGFGNATDPVETTVTNMPPEAAAPATRPKCEPGLYLGQYNCDVTIAGFPFPLMGDVSFNLEINEEIIEAECQEFCADLVIAEGSGTLFGLAGFTGFEAQLEGGLDCQTGEFRASAPGGIYGAAISSDPSDPNALWTVQQPPLGNFTGELEGTHTPDPPQQIEGHWNLADSVYGATCAGPFTVVLQP